MLKKLFGGKDKFYISLDNKQAPTSPSPADSPPVQPESSQPVVAATATEEAKVAVAPDKASAKKSKKTSIKKQKVAKAEEETSGASVVVAPPDPKRPLTLNRLLSPVQSQSSKTLLVELLDPV